MGAQPDRRPLRAERRGRPGAGGDRRGPAPEDQPAQAPAGSRHPFGSGEAVRSRRPGPPADGGGVQPGGSGGGRGPVRPAGRHFGRVLASDGRAGAVRVLRRRGRFPGVLRRHLPETDEKSGVRPAAAGGGAAAGSGKGRRLRVLPRQRPAVPQRGGPGGRTGEECPLAGPGGHGVPAGRRGAGGRPDGAAPQPE